jgi:hypothetical protein
MTSTAEAMLGCGPPEGDDPRVPAVGVRAAAGRPPDPTLTRHYWTRRTVFASDQCRSSW